MALAEGRIAYAVDRSSAGFPGGSVIRVRSLATGALERTITTPTTVIELALSASMVAWIECPNALARDGGTSWELRRAALAAGSPETIPTAADPSAYVTPIEHLGLDGSAVLADVHTAESRSPTLIRADGPSSLTVISSGAVWCRPAGASGGLVILGCFAEGHDEQPAIWSEPTGLRVIAGIPGASLWTVRVTGEWVTWEALDLGHPRIVMSGAPISAFVEAVAH